MTSLQSESTKIKKQPKNSNDGEKNFICGGCGNQYMSYPALYLHIKRKHEGERPPNTRIHRPVRPKLHIAVQPGRPNKTYLKKPSKEIDKLDETEASLETAQNDLMNFLGEKLFIFKDLGPKVPLEAINIKMLESCRDFTDKWSTELQQEISKFISEYTARDLRMRHLDYEEEFMLLDHTNRLRVLAWFMVWLMKIYVKPEFIPELCLIFPKIWKVLDETQLSVQDLDNKLVWKKVAKDCEGIMPNLASFKDNQALLSEFIQKVCQLIGKTFENK